MKKSIISGVVGIIFGFVACIMSIYGILHKICKVPIVKDEIIKSIKNFIIVLFYGERRVNYVPVYKGGYGQMSYSRCSKSFDYRYRECVTTDISNAPFVLIDDAEGVLSEIEKLINDDGYLSVSEVYSLITEKTRHEFHHRYLDTKYGWTNAERFYINETRRSLVVPRPSKLNDICKEELA